MVQDFKDLSTWYRLIELDKKMYGLPFHILWNYLRIILSSSLIDLNQYTEVRFASLLSGGFTTMAVINPPEKKLEKRTSLQWATQTKQLGIKLLILTKNSWFLYVF